MRSYELSGVSDCPAGIGGVRRMILLELEVAELDRDAGQTHQASCARPVEEAGGVGRQEPAVGKDPSRN